MTSRKILTVLSAGAFAVAGLGTGAAVAYAAVDRAAPAVSPTATPPPTPSPDGRGDQDAMLRHCQEQMRQTHQDMHEHMGDAGQGTMPRP